MNFFLHSSNTFMTKAKKGKHEMMFDSTGPVMMQTSSLTLHKKDSLALKAHISWPFYVADFQASERQ